MYVIIIRVNMILTHYLNACVSTALMLIIIKMCM